MSKIIKRHYLNRMLDSITPNDYLLCRKFDTFSKLFLKEELNILIKMIRSYTGVIHIYEYIPKEYHFDINLDCNLKTDLKFLARKKIVYCWIYLLDYDWSIKDKVEYIDKELREYLLKIVQGEK